MKVNKLILRATIFLFVITLISFKGMPAKAAESNYAVIDVVKIMGESHAVNDIKEQINVFKEHLQKQAAVEKNKLQNDERSLIQKKNDLSPKDFNEAREKFQSKVQKIQQSFYNKSQNVDKVGGAALNIVQNKVAKIVDSIAKEKKYSIIYQANALAYFPKNKDITEDVVKQLNKELPKVKVKNPFKN